MKIISTIWLVITQIYKCLITIPFYFVPWTVGICCKSARTGFKEGWRDGV